VPDAQFPEGSVDTHIHFYDARFPSAPAAVLHPPDASVDDYRQIQRRLGTSRTVVVQPTTYGLDNSCQLEAMETLGDDARGVAVVDSTVSVGELARLTAAGFRGARFHLLPGGALPAKMLVPVASKVADFGWHIQLQLDGRELTDRLRELLTLPCDLVVDHIGLFASPIDESTPGFAALRTLISRGRCWVKLSAPYLSSETGPPEFTDVGALARVLVADAPERMLWATNWPHPGQEDPPSPEALGDLIRDWAGTERTLRRILVDNPTVLYGFDTTGD